MAPTAFNDFQAKANNLFDEHHNAGKNTFAKSGKIGGGDYTMTLENEHGSSNVSWKMESTCCKHAGMTIDSDSTIAHDITFNVKQVNGLSLKFNPSFNPTSGLNLGNLNANFENDKINLNLGTDMPGLSSIDYDISADVKGTNIGMCGAFNLKSGECGGMKFGWNRSGEDFEVSYVNHDLMTPHKGIFSYYKGLKDNHFCCVGLQGNSVNNTVAIALGEGKCCGNTTRYKLDNNGMFSVANVNSLNKNVKLNLSAVINMKNMKGGGHNFGMGFSFQ